MAKTSRDARSLVIAPVSLQELFAQWARYPDAALFSGCLRQFGPPRAARFVFPATLITLENIEELRRVTRTDKYLETGSMVHLNRLLSLGQAAPELLRGLLSRGETLAARGVIPAGSVFFASFPRADGSDAPPPEEPRGVEIAPSARTLRALRAAFFALGASCELRSAIKSRWVPAQCVWGGAEKAFTPGEREILCRVRVPLEKWDWTLLRSFPGTFSRDESYGAFLARIQNDTLEEARLVLSGPELIHDIDHEGFLAGKKLPLRGADIAAYHALWRDLLAGSEKTPDFLKQRFLAFVYEVLAHFRGTAS